jgi:uncharacterized protein
VIVDFRIRPPYKSFTKTHLFGRRNPNPDPVTVNGLMIDMPAYKSFDELSMDAFLDEMDAAGIDVGVVTGRVAPAPYNGVDNDDIAELVEKWPDRFIGFGAVDPEAADLAAEVDKLADRGFRGVGVDSGWVVPPMYDDDERLFPLYERCAERGLICTITASIFVGPDLSYSDPIHIQHVAQRFPELKIVVAHGSWPWTTNACAVAFQNSNVYLMPDIYMNIANTPGADEYVRSANYFLSHRLIHASSYPVRPLDDALNGLRALPFDSREILDRVAGLNGARLLGLDPSKPRISTPVVTAAGPA